MSCLRVSAVCETHPGLPLSGEELWPPRVFTSGWFFRTICNVFTFEVKKELGSARLSELATPHGVIAGPFFQFVATQAAIRGMVFSEDLRKMGVQIVLANTYHLHLRPGEDVVAGAGGLHGFMKWNFPITTDSGGYQVFSLGQNVKVDDDGVTFRSPSDGSPHRFTPEGVIQIQRELGADLIMPLDVCTPFGASRDEVARAVERTYKWACRCRKEYETEEVKEPSQALYGIVQGGVYSDLRREAAERMRELDFFGYSVGGELREGNEKSLAEVVPATTRHLPENKPRYLMGYGLPEDIIEAVRYGVDHFDCVIPIRNARHGHVFYGLDEGEIAKCLSDSSRKVIPEKLYRAADMKKGIWADDYSVFSPGHPVIKEPYSKAYVHHLMRAESPSGVRLAVLHNIYFYARLMKIIREVIQM